MSLLQDLDQRLEVLARLEREVADLTAQVRADPADKNAMRSLAMELMHVYGCIEDIGYVVTRDVNGEVPGGPSGHTALLRRLYLAVPEKRDPVFWDARFEDLNELRKFRHVIRTRYGIDLDRDKLLSVADRAVRAMPAARSDVKRLRDRLAASEPGSVP